MLAIAGTGCVGVIVKTTIAAIPQARFLIMTADLLCSPPQLRVAGFQVFASSNRVAFEPAASNTMWAFGQPGEPANIQMEPMHLTSHALLPEVGAPGPENRLGRRA